MPCWSYKAVLLPGKSKSRNIQHADEWGNCCVSGVLNESFCSLTPPDVSHSHSKTDSSVSQMWSWPPLPSEKWVLKVRPRWIHFWIMHILRPNSTSDNVKLMLKIMMTFDGIIRRIDNILSIINSIQLMQQILPISLSWRFFISITLLV